MFDQDKKKYIRFKKKKGVQDFKFEAYNTH